MNTIESTSYSGVHDEKRPLEKADRLIKKRERTGVTSERKWIAHPV